jgi:quinoprotein glucose dehydrogenase
MVHIVDAAFSTVISGAIFALLGVYFAGAGTWLAVLGGIWYYAIAGAGLIATGVLLILGRRLALAEGDAFGRLILASTESCQINGFPPVTATVVPEV